jgi:hypothetical protein
MVVTKALVLMGVQDVLFVTAPICAALLLLHCVVQCSRSSPSHTPFMRCHTHTHTPPHGAVQQHEPACHVGCCHRGLQGSQATCRVSHQHTGGTHHLQHTRQVGQAAGRQCCMVVQGERGLAAPGCICSTPDSPVCVKLFPTMHSHTVPAALPAPPRLLTCCTKSCTCWLHVL